MGITTANLIWCLPVVLGLVVLFTLVPWLYNVLRVAGGVYLIYLGLSYWFTSRHSDSTPEPPLADTSILPYAAYARGLLTALLNPKSVVYFGSIFTLFMRPGTPSWVQTAAVGIVCFDTVLWYGAVGLLFSSEAPRRLHGVMRRPIERVAGAIMVAFGARLVLVRD